MHAWMPPTGDESPQAAALRERWFERWGGSDLVHGLGDAPDGVVDDCVDAYPAFRCPLSWEEEQQAARDFQRGALEALACGRPVTVVTIEWEWGCSGSRTTCRSRD